MVFFFKIWSIEEEILQAIKAGDWIKCSKTNNVQNTYYDLVSQKIILEGFRFCFVKYLLAVHKRLNLKSPRLRISLFAVFNCEKFPLGLFMNE